MKLTQSDMGHPQFWDFNAKAGYAVRKAIMDAIGTNMLSDDNAANAAADAIDALTKAMILTEKAKAQKEEA